MASSSSSPYDGGAGGKIRRRAARPAASPYARPPEAARRPAGEKPVVAGRAGWISKLVDPASRFISGSAGRLLSLSAVFKQRVPALENANENTIHEAEEELPPLITPANQPAAPNQIISDATMNDQARDDIGPKSDKRIPQKDDRISKRDDKHPINPIPTNSVMNISEIEQLLAQKTFTKEQFDRLTDLLRARTVEPNLPHKEKETVLPPFRQNLAESSRKQGMFSTPASTILVAKQEAATSPMELAKAYMNSKSSKGYPSALRLRTRIFTERKPLPFLADTTHASAKSSGSGLTLVPRQNITHFDPSRDGFATPRSLGRTAISRMCRSPFVKAPGSSSNAYASKFSPYDTPTGSTSAGKEVLKRGSAALYEDIGTVGPIRRIRQKLNLTAPPKEPTPSLYRNFVHTSPKTLMDTNPKTLTDTNRASTSTQKRLELTNDGYDSDMRDEIQDEEMKSGKFRFDKVPPRSTEMATKILDAVGKMTKSPLLNQEVRRIEGLEREEREMGEKSEGKLVVQTNGGNLGFGARESEKGKAVLDLPAPKNTKPSFRMSLSEDLLDDDDEEETNTNTQPETTVPVKNVFNKVESSTSDKHNNEPTSVPNPLPILTEKVKSVPTPVVSSPSTEPDSKKPALVPPASETRFKFTSDAKFQMPETSASAVESSSEKDKNAPAPLFGFGLKKEEKSEAPASPFSWASSNAGAKADSDKSKPASVDVSDSGRITQKRKSEETPKLPETSIAPPAQSPPPIFSFGASTSPSSTLTNGSHESPPKFSFGASPAVTPPPEPTKPAETPDAPKLPVNPFGSGFPTAAANSEFSSPAPKVPSFQFGASPVKPADSQAAVPDDSGTKVLEPSPIKLFALTNTTSTGTSSLITGTGTSSSAGTNGTATFGLFSSSPISFGTGTRTGTATEAGTGAGTGTVTGAGTTGTGTGAGAGTAGTGTGAAPFLFGNSGSSTGTYTFGASSQPASSSSSSQSAAFSFGSTNPGSTPSASLFDFGSSTQNPSSNPSSTSSQLAFTFGASPSTVFNAKPAQSQSSGSQLSTPALFGNTSTGFGTTSFTSSATSASSAQSGLFGSGFGSAQSAPSTAPSVFGTTSFGTGTGTAPTGFGFGQSSSAPGSSFAFGAQPQSSPTLSFGASNPNPGTGAGTGFGLSNPNPGTGAGTGFGSSNPNSGTATGTGFGLSNPNSGTGSSMGFGLSNPNSGTGFGLSNPNPSTNNDHMSMEDSMVDDKLPPVPAFGQPPAPAFGQPPASPFGQPVSPFGQQPGGFTFGATANQQPPAGGFQPPASNLGFSAGTGGFSQGSNAAEKGNRKIIRPSRNKNRVRK